MLQALDDAAVGAWYRAAVEALAQAEQDNLADSQFLGLITGILDDAPRPGGPATFSPELSDLTIYVIDVAAGEKIPRKGGPGITKSDLFVINKTDLAPYVGADLGVMKADTLRMRRDKPFVMTNLKTRDGLAEVVAFIERKGLLTQA